MPRLSKSVGSLIRSFALHCATGLLAVFAHYAIMWLLLQQGLSPVIASGTGFFFGAIVRFLFSHFAVFTPEKALPTTLAKFSAALAMQLCANTLLLSILVAASAPIWWAQVFVTIFMTFINYGVYRFWVFK